jgi:hypothetical protein
MFGIQSNSFQLIIWRTHNMGILQKLGGRTIDDKLSRPDIG